MAKDHGPQIKDDTLYEDLLKQGNSKQKATRRARFSTTAYIWKTGR